MSELNDFENELKVRQEILTMALRPQGIIGEIAHEIVRGSVELTPEEVCDIILPPKQTGEVMDARWELVAGAKDIIRDAVEANKETIFSLADQLGMRRDSSLPQADIDRIDPDKAQIVVEGGANRTSVVRRALAYDLDEGIHGSAGEHEWISRVIQQLGSDRPIPRLRKDGSPNPEYHIALEIAGNHLPEDDSLTEFKLNLASAFHGGYRIDPSLWGGEIISDDGLIKRETFLRPPKNGSRLWLAQPDTTVGGLKHGLEALVGRSLFEGRQLVIVSNGQYRPKNELVATQLMREHPELKLLPPVTIGDEAGYKVEHNERALITAARGPIVYLNEAVILERLYRQSLKGK